MVFIMNTRLDGKQFRRPRSYFTDVVKRLLLHSNFSSGTKFSLLSANKVKIFRFMFFIKYFKGKMKVVLFLI